MTDNIHNTAIYTIQSKHHEQYQFLPRAKLCPCPSVRPYVRLSRSSIRVEISGEFFIFQQDSARAYRASLLKWEIPAFISSDMWLTTVQI